MTDNFNALVKELLPFAGQVCVVYRSELVLLQGLGMDESDYYYIVDYAARNRPRSWCSAVGHLEPLKPYLPDEMYAGMLNHFALQNVTPKRFDLIAEMDGERYRLNWDGEKATRGALLPKT